EKMSPPQRQVMQAHEALARLAEAKTPPTLADLRGQDADGVNHAMQLWRDRGQPLALATLAELPPESRGAALKHYFDNGAEGIGGEQMAGLDGLALSVEEKSALLATGAQARWQREADGAAALDWIQRIPDRAAWPEVTREVIEGYARLDPQAALDYAQNSMPDGPLREQLEQAANAALP
ncbi:MAG: hypothetical protein JWO82_1319, partial [Akkermansiaceae bacterium]|nr:hypothetical protein [Akkermansiaceae bacterium]